MNAEPNLWQLVSIAIALGAMLFSAATFVRAGRWRETDDGRRTSADIGKLKERMTVVETKLEDMPSKADFTALEAQLEGVEKMLRNTEAGVQRIEGYMMTEKSR